MFFPKGGMFFLEGQFAAGVFLLRRGTAKESMVSSTGRIAIIRVVGPGAILGVAAVLTGTPHDYTVEALEPCHADFLAKTQFLDLLKTSSHLGKTVADQLNRDLQRRIRLRALPWSFRFRVRKTRPADSPLGGISHGE